MFLFNGASAANEAGRRSSELIEEARHYVQPPPPTWWDYNEFMIPLQDIIRAGDIKAAQKWLQKNKQKADRNHPNWAKEAAFEAAVSLQREIMDYLLKYTPKSHDACYKRYCERLCANLAVARVPCENLAYVKTWVSTHLEILKKYMPDWANEPALRAAGCNKKDIMDYLLPYTTRPRSEFISHYRKSAPFRRRLSNLWFFLKYGFCFAIGFLLPSNSASQPNLDCVKAGEVQERIITNGKRYALSPDMKENLKLWKNIEAQKIQNNGYAQAKNSGLRKNVLVF